MDYITHYLDSAQITTVDCVAQFDCFKAKMVKRFFYNATIFVSPIFYVSWLYVFKLVFFKIFVHCLKCEVTYYHTFHMLRRLYIETFVQRKMMT